MESPTSSGDSPQRFDEVFKTELKEIQDRRGKFQPHSAPKEATGNCQAGNLVGLALSGGGIRSATFCLGVLQGLRDLHLLQVFDYLSTASVVRRGAI
jgi:hypothetical protein